MRILIGRDWPAYIQGSHIQGRPVPSSWRCSRGRAQEGLGATMLRRQRRQDTWRVRPVHNWDAMKNTIAATLILCS